MAKYTDNKMCYYALLNTKGNDYDHVCDNPWQSESVPLSVEQNDDIINDDHWPKGCLRIFMGDGPDHEWAQQEFQRLKRKHPKFRNKVLAHAKLRAIAKGIYKHPWL